MRLVLADDAVLLREGLVRYAALAYPRKLSQLLPSPCPLAIHRYKADT